MNKYQQGKIIMGRLKKGEDLLIELTKLVKENNIETGKVEVIGAVTEACFGYYNQDKKEYEYNTIKEGLEIVNCTGNISLLDGKSMIHAHIVLADNEGHTYGGHLAEGTKIFASEAIIYELKGKKLNRTFDKETELTLW